MLFGNQNDDTINIKYDDVDVEVVHKFNFLGITIDDKLTWHHHIMGLDTKQ